MSAIFDCLFFCCKARRSDEEGPTENSRILESTDIAATSVPSYDSVSIDHTKARERLNGIVKSKEGKMVRVLSRLPFNLRSDSANGVSNPSSSRSDRSPSANVNHPQDRTAGYFNDQGISRLSSRSASMSSVLQASTSRLSATDDMLDATTEHKLKVQIVPSAKSKARVLSRRGRSKTRYGRLGDDMEDHAIAPALEGIQSVDSGRENTNPPLQADQTQSERSNALISENRPEVSSSNSEDDNSVRAISKDISKNLDDSFDDVGTLTRSWGD